MLEIVSKLLQPTQQSVALTGRNRTGPQCSVGRQTTHAPGRRRAERPIYAPGRFDRRQRYRRRRQTPANKAIKQYWPIRLAAGQ